MHPYRQERRALEHLLRRAVVLACVLAAGACRNEAALERREKRALEESVSQAKDEVHKLDLKELAGAELSPEEVALRQRLKEQAEEDENGGNAPSPTAAEPADEPGEPFAAEGG